MFKKICFVTAGHHPQVRDLHNTLHLQLEGTPLDASVKSEDAGLHVLQLARFVLRLGHEDVVLSRVQACEQLVDSTLRSDRSSLHQPVPKPGIRDDIRRGHRGEKRARRNVGRFGAEGVELQR